MIIMFEKDKLYVIPFGSKLEGEWLEGEISGEYLCDNFGHLETLDDCIQATESEGLKLFFESLKT